MIEKPSSENRAIVVDDDLEMRQSLGHLLEKAGWRCVLLGRAEDVAARIESFRPEVILSDMRMPGMGGLELVRSLRQAEHRRWS